MDGEAWLTPGTIFDRYRIRRPLERGGMSLVYEAEHVHLGKRVALKTMPRELAEDPSLRRRFLREAERTAQIKHPNVVDVTDLGEYEAVPYLVMEYLEGESLATLLERERQLSVARSVTLTLPVLAATRAAHALDIAHRDIKPENIFIERRGENFTRPKLFDFGISRLTTEAARERLTAPDQALGSPMYMAPEQARGEAGDLLSDQYALAATLYEMLTGRPLREGKHLIDVLAQAVEGRFTPAGKLLPSLPPDLDAALCRAMQADPARRFPDVGAFGVALVPFVEDDVAAYWGAELSDEATEEGMDLSGELFMDWKQVTEVPPPMPLADTEVPPAPTAGDDAPAPLASAAPRPSGAELPTSQETAVSVMREVSPSRDSLDAQAKAPSASARGRGLGAWAVAAFTMMGLGGSSAWWAVGGPEVVAPCETALAAALPAPRVMRQEAGGIQLSVRCTPRKGTRVLLDEAVLAAEGAYDGVFPGDGKAYRVSCEDPAGRSVSRSVLATGQAIRLGLVVHD